MTVVVLLLTVRLSGHRHSLGILVIGLFGFYFVAFLTGAVLKTFGVINRLNFYVFSVLLLVSFSLFFIFHHSYDSYNETRSLFWGFNGE